MSESGQHFKKQDKESYYERLSERQYQFVDHPTEFVRVMEENAKYISEDQHMKDLQVAQQAF